MEVSGVRPREKALVILNITNVLVGNFSICIVVWMVARATVVHWIYTEIFYLVICKLRHGQRVHKSP